MVPLWDGTWEDDLNVREEKYFQIVSFYYVISLFYFKICLSFLKFTLSISFYGFPALRRYIT